MKTSKWRLFGWRTTEFVEQKGGNFWFRSAALVYGGTRLVYVRDFDLQIHTGNLQLQANHHTAESHFRWLSIVQNINKTLRTGDALAREPLSWKAFSDSNLGDHHSNYNSLIWIKKNKIEKKSCRNFKFNFKLFGTSLSDLLTLALASPFFSLAAFPKFTCAKVRKKSWPTTCRLQVGLTKGSRELQC